MDPLGQPLTTHPIQTNSEISIEPYQIWRIRSIANQDSQFAKGSDPTRSRTRTDGPEPLL